VFCHLHEERCGYANVLRVTFFILKYGEKTVKKKVLSSAFIIFLFSRLCGPNILRGFISFYLVTPLLLSALIINTLTSFLSTYTVIYLRLASVG
jgi:hypothetical protein